MSTIRVCDHCDGEVHEKTLGNEGWSICIECGLIEGGDHEEEVGNEDGN